MFREAEIHFTFMFDSGGRVDNQKLARRLLSAEIAETAIRSADGEVLVSPRFKELQRTRRRAERLKRASEGSLRDLIRESIQSPRLAAAVLKALSPVKITREEDAPAVDETPVLKNQEAPGEAANRAVEFIDRSVADLRIESAIFHAVDKEFLSPQYLESDPYIRLRLRGFEYELGLPSKDGVDGSVAKIMATPDIMLHASGVTMLTIVIQVPAMATRELLSCTRSDWITFSRTIMPEAVLAPYAASLGSSVEDVVGEWEQEIRAGTRWRDSRFKEPVTLADVFAIYHEALIREGRLPGSSHNWMCYPKVFIEGLYCCGNKKSWLSSHSRELAGIVTRAPWYARMSDEYTCKQLEKDLVEAEDASMFANVGSATRLKWTFGSRSMVSADPVNNLIDSTVISQALMQFGQLRMLERLTVSRDRGGKSASLAEEMLVYGLHEASNQNLSFGTARAISQHISTELGVPDMYLRVRERLDLMRQVSSFAHGRAAARRANKIAAVALLVAATVALPNLNEGLQAISGAEAMKDISGLSTIHEFASSGPTGAVVLFAILMLAVTVFLVPLPLRRRRSRSSTRIGMSWPNQQIDVAMKQERPVGSPKDLDIGGAAQLETSSEM